MERQVGITFGGEWKDSVPVLLELSEYQNAHNPPNLDVLNVLMCRVCFAISPNFMVNVTSRDDIINLFNISRKESQMSDIYIQLPP